MFVSIQTLSKIPCTRERLLLLLLLVLLVLLLLLLLLFTEFAQPGVVHVGVQLARLDSPLFPKFRIRVRNPLESILDVVPHTHANAPSSTALLAAVVAYLGHCDDKELEELDMKMDGTLVNILRSALPHVADWKLSYFLSGGLLSSLDHPAWHQLTYIAVIVLIN